MNVISWFLDLLYPPKCVFCRKLLPEGQQDVCDDCRIWLPNTSGEIKHISFCKGAYSLYYYEDDVPGSVRRFKFSGKSGYGRSYGRLLAQEILRQKIPYDLITFVPVSAKRRFARGYDQCRLMGKTVGRELSAPVHRCLVKHRDNPAQSGLKDSSQRAANVRGVYRSYKPERFSGKKILLIDDVLTTGATVSECCNVLMLAGASEVRCLTLAAARKLYK